MVEVCRKDPNVRKLVVFGSSVTAACNPWSDIDIYFDLERETGIFPSSGDRAVFDKWDNYSVSEELLEEIKKTGVVVYEKKD